MRVTVINLLVALIVFTIIAIGILYYTSSDSAGQTKSTPVAPPCDPNDPSLCKDGYKCIKNACELLPLADGAYCDDDSECNTETSKCVNEECKITCTDSQNSGTGTCVAVAGVAQVCVNGFCQNYLPDGSACSMDSECNPLTSKCVNQVCAIPSNTDCSSKNTTGTCTEAAGVIRVCNALGQCVNPDTLPCGSSNPNGTCTNPTDSCVNGSCTASVPNNPCGPQNTTGFCQTGQVCSPAQGGVCVPQNQCGIDPNGTCPDPTQKCEKNVCTDGTACGPSNLNGTCANTPGKTCNPTTGVCDVPEKFACGPGNETPPATSLTGYCYLDTDTCISGECKATCNGNVCPLGAICSSDGESCVYAPPIKECQYSYGDGTFTSPLKCNANYPICEMFVAPSTYGICVTEPSICTQDLDCQNTAYPNGICVQGDPNKLCAYPSPRPADVPSNLIIILNDNGYTPTQWNHENQCEIIMLNATYSSTWTPSPAIQPCGMYGSDYNISTNTLKTSTLADSLPPGFDMDCICDTDFSKFCWAGMTGGNTNNNMPEFYICT